MSMFRTLQAQPRTVTIFTHVNKDRFNLTNLREVISDLKFKEKQNELKLDIQHVFPTWEQLRYMNACKPHDNLLIQVPKLDEILQFSQNHKIFQSTLSNLNIDNKDMVDSKNTDTNITSILNLNKRAAQKLYWNTNTSIYIDWENETLKLIQLYHNKYKYQHKGYFL